MQVNRELLPCPFCGEKLTLEAVDSFNFIEFFHSQPSGCKMIITSSAHSYDVAIENYNRRS